MQALLLLTFLRILPLALLVFHKVPHFHDCCNCFCYMGMSMSSNNRTVSLLNNRYIYFRLHPRNKRLSTFHSNRSAPPTALKEREGLLTPPTICSKASLCNASDFVNFTTIHLLTKSMYYSNMFSKRRIVCDSARQLGKLFVVTFRRGSDYEIGN